MPAASLGLWVLPVASVGARVSNFWYVPDDQATVNGYVGAELRLVPIPQLLLGGGVGVLLLGEVGDNSKAGVGFDLRGAFLPIQIGSHGLGIFGEWIRGIVDGAFTYSAGGGVIWAVL